ncbi:MAG TPA: ornithine carbamoyltransferase [Deltaproteobacteria bacterium]|nr:ornithine carbamoyltransferase [Deltaproteobacteria bacterium]
MAGNLLTIGDLDRAAVEGLIERARSMKGRLRRGIRHEPLKGRILGLIFEKPSTRTRVSFETAMRQLGGGSIFISHRDSQIGRGEPIKDTARVMSGYVDAVVIRTFGHEIIEEYARYSAIPVINGLTDDHHPCQVLADLLTVVEKFGGLEGIEAAWIGDGNNMANSWIEAAALMGFRLRLACPEGYRPERFFEAARRAGAANIEMVGSAEEAARGAHVLNTDVWASMGREDERRERVERFRGYTIDSRLLELARPDAIVLHCLPAHRGEEITDEVIEGPRSAVWDQAENRLHMQKAVLERLLCAQ